MTRDRYYSILHILMIAAGFGFVATMLSALFVPGLFAAGYAGIIAVMMVWLGLGVFLRHVDQLSRPWVWVFAGCALAAVATVVLTLVGSSAAFYVQSVMFVLLAVLAVGVVVARSSSSSST